MVVANCAHEIVGRNSAPVPADSQAAERAAQAIRAVEELVRRENISLAPVQGIGLGLPGFVQNPASADRHAMTPFAGHVAAELGRHFGAPVLTDNNSRLAALAEVTWGAARGFDNAVYLRWSQGVGGGLVVNGSLVHGAHGAAGEIGHTSCDPEGKPCHCGGRGCLEGLISVPALLAACAERGVDAGDADELIALAAEGRPEVADVLRERPSPRAGCSPRSPPRSIRSASSCTGSRPRSTTWSSLRSGNRSLRSLCRPPPAPSRCAVPPSAARRRRWAVWPCCCAPRARTWRNCWTARRRSRRAPPTTNGLPHERLLRAGP